MKAHLIIKDRVRKGNTLIERVVWLEQLIMDFEADVLRLSGDKNESDH